ncbi:hypothetical protein NQ317_000347 [Molorchus minor]|uniref:Bcl-2 Bcl-2 homology region 1-3 domain-containing protein n=1 Tax=Molorchus minor TaxID=1323400 RepID=A0ABQ9K119_9CUCU|nr:hypothetical protein NQ317_000347 [Molorchus minor]
MELNSVGYSDRKPTVPYRLKRKYSIPVTLTISPSGNEQVAFRRRFSNVGDAMSRKLSTTIGWRSVVGGSPPEEIVAVGRALCSLYIRTRLKRAGVFNRKLGLTRVRSAVGSLTGCGAVVRDVFPGLACACSELERMYPKLFTKITRQTGPAPAGGVGGLLLAVGHYLLRSDPTWGKLVAIYCVAGGLAVDCVRQGCQDNLHIILEDMTELLEDRMAYWVNANGGWTGLNAHCRARDEEICVVHYFAIFGLVATIILVIYFLVRFFIKMGY